MRRIQVVVWTGSYNVPLVLMAVMTAISAVLWLKIDPTVQIIREESQP